MISVQQAEEAILSFFEKPLESEEVDLQWAAGRILRQDIVADRDLPPFDRATLDGIALSSRAAKSGRTEFTILGTAAAGDPQQTLADRQAGCLEIMTGAALPVNADCVVPVEELDMGEGVARLKSSANLDAGHGVHPQGSDEAKGNPLLPSGRRLTAKEMAVVASVGSHRIRVSPQLRIRIITTGNELVPIEQKPLPHQIRRSNDLALATALKAAGHPETRAIHLPDEPEAIDAGLAESLGEADVLILAGGISKGKFDYLPDALQRAGVVRLFQWVSQRPGKPMWCGHVDGRERPFPVFALPGNPVSCFTCLRRYVLPALDRWLGLDPPPPPQFAQLSKGFAFKKPLTLFLPVVLRHSEDARALADPIPFNTSGDFASVAHTDGFLELPKERDSFPAGTALRYFSWSV